MDFTGKRVWVTGAARGIGEQIARHFLTQAPRWWGLTASSPTRICLTLA